MKKLFVVLIFGILLLGLTGCGKSNTLDNNNAQNNQNENNNDLNRDELLAIYQKLNRATVKIDVISSDLFASWSEYLRHDNLTKNQIVSISSLDYNDLIREECDGVSLVNKKPVIYCIVAAHRSKNSYTEIWDLKEEANVMIYEFEVTEKNKRVLEELTEFHNTIHNYLNISEFFINNAIGNYKDKVTDIKNNITNSRTRIDLLLDYNYRLDLENNNNDGRGDAGGPCDFIDPEYAEVYDENGEKIVCD